MDYRCPACGVKLFEASGQVPVQIEMKCRCGEVVSPEARNEVLHRTYRCTECDRTMHVERPSHKRSYCAVCGTDTLTVVEETRKSRTLIPENNQSGRIQFAGVRTRE